MKKFFWFSVLASIFGWLWILSSLGFIAVLIWCLFFDLSWKWLGFIFVTGALSKWLLRGFRDNAERERLERYLIQEKGFNSEQAYKLWQEAYSRGDGAILKVYSLEDKQLEFIKKNDTISN